MHMLQLLKHPMAASLLAFKIQALLPHSPHHPCSTQCDIPSPLDCLALSLHAHVQEKKKGPGKSINRLLNRLLGVHVEKQKKIFAYFMMVLVSCGAWCW
jgi:hypothetical protein